MSSLPRNTVISHGQKEVAITTLVSRRSVHDKYRYNVHPMLTILHGEKDEICSRVGGQRATIAESCCGGKGARLEIGPE